MLLLWMTFLCLSVCCTFTVIYNNNTPSMELATATSYALKIMDTYIITKNPIVIQLNLESMNDAELLANCNIASTYIHPQNKSLLIPSSLYTQLFGDEPIPGPHMYMSISTNSRVPFYFGVDGNTPNSHVDYVRVFLHEAMHGLGFVTFFDSPEHYSKSPLVYVYDAFLFLNQPFPTTMLTNELLLFNDGVEVYNPPTFKKSVSLIHAADPNSLLFYEMPSGKSLHCFTADCIFMLKSMGYNLSSSAEPCVVSTASSLHWLWNE